MVTASRWVRVIAALALLGGARPAWAGSAELAKNLESEEAECRFLLFLCQQANRAEELAARVSPDGNTELLAFKRAKEAGLRKQDAVTAARVIDQKHPGEKPWCFEDPACEFLQQALAPPRRSPAEE